VKNLKAISEAYERIDNHFDEMRERFRNNEELDRIKEEQQLNNQAYFFWPGDSWKRRSTVHASMLLMQGSHRRSGKLEGHGI